MILTNNRFGDIIMENTNFDKHYDVFHAFLVKDAEYDGYILNCRKLKRAIVCPQN